MKTHFKTMKNPNYIGSWDLMDNEGKLKNLVVTIVSVTKEHVFDGNGKSEECPVIKLKECKPLVANVTNLKAIAKVTGSSFIEDWAGKRIELTVKKIKAFGEFHDAIRVVESAPKAPQLPELIEGSENWEKVVAALKGGFKLEQVKQKYAITPEIETKLKEVCNV